MSIPPVFLGIVYSILLTFELPRLDLPLYIETGLRVPLADQNDFLTRRNRSILK